MAAKQVFEIELKGLAQGAVQAVKLRDNLEGLREKIGGVQDAQEKAQKQLRAVTAGYKSGAVAAEDYEKQNAELTTQIAKLSKQNAVLTAETVKSEAAVALQTRTLNDLQDAALNAEAALAQVPAGSAQYGQIVAALAPVRAELALIQSDLDNLNPANLVSQFAALGDSITGAFSGGVSAIAGLTGESEEAEKALKAIETAAAAVAAARAIAEGRLAAIQAIRVVRQRILNKETGVFTKLQEGASNATAGFGKALTSTEGATKAVRGGLLGVGKAIAATGIGLLVVLLGTLAAELLSNVKFLKFVTNAFSSLQAVIKPFAERVVPSIVAGFTALKQVLTFDFSGAAKTVSDEFGAIKGAFSEAGSALAAEQERQAKAAALQVERDNLQLLELQQGLNEALLSGQAKQQGALLSSQLEFQKRKTELARQTLTIDLKLSNEQIAIIEKGTAAEVAALTAKLKQEKRLNDESIASIQAYTQERAALVQKQVEADRFALEEAKKQADARRNLLREQLASDNTFAGQSRKIALEKEQALADIAAREAAGEVVLQEEKLAVQTKFANDARKLTIAAGEAQRRATLELQKQELDGITTLAAEKTRVELELNDQLADIKARRARGEQVFAQEEERIRLAASQKLQELARAESEQLTALENQRLEQQIASRERALQKTQEAFDKESALRVRSREEVEKARQAELAAIQQISALQQQRIDADLRVLEAQRLKLDPAEFKRQFEAIQQTRLDLVNTYNDRVEAANKAFDDKQQANRERETALFIQQQDLRSNAARQASSESQRAIEREVELQRQALDGSEGLAAQRKAAAAIASLAVAEEERSLALLREQNQIENQKLDAQIKQLETKGNITEEDRLQIEQLKQAKIDLGVQLDVDTKAITDQTRAVAAETSQVLADQLKSGLEDPLNVAIGNIFAKATQGMSALEKQVIASTLQAGQQLAQQTLALFEQLEQARLQKLQASQAQLQERASAVDAELDAARTRLQDLEKQTSELAASGTAASEAREAQLAGEGARVKQLEKQRAELAAQERANAKEQERIQREAAKRQKAIAIAQAVANTALGVTNVMATVPAADFGVIRSILIATTLALGAAQVATIAATPSFAAGGRVGPDGQPEFAAGGVLQGPPHAQGGVPGVVRRTGAAFEAEGGEFITRKAATANNLPALDAINRYGDKVKFEARPAFTSTTTAPTASPPDAATLEVLAALANRPAHVSVVDIVNGISTYQRIVARATV